MRTTAAERRIGDALAQCLSLLSVAALLALAVWCTGCASGEGDVDARIQELEANITAVQRLGVKGEAILLWGDGHVFGQAFNVSGSHGIVRVTIEPDAAPSD